MSRANLSEPSSEDSSEANCGGVTVGCGESGGSASLEWFGIRSERGRSTTKTARSRSSATFTSGAQLTRGASATPWRRARA